MIFNIHRIFLEPVLTLNILVSTRPIASNRLTRENSVPVHFRFSLIYRSIQKLQCLKFTLVGDDILQLAPLIGEFQQALSVKFGLLQDPLKAQIL